MKPQWVLTGLVWQYRHDVCFGIVYPSNKSTKYPWLWEVLTDINSRPTGSGPPRGRATSLENGKTIVEALLHGTGTVEDEP